MEYTYTWSGGEPDAFYGLMGMLAGFMAVMVFVLIALAIFMIVVKWRLFTKAGIEGWKSLIPFYSDYLWYRMICGNGWLMFSWLVALIPVIGQLAFLAFNIYVVYCLSRAFGKSSAFCIGLIFFPIVFMPMLAFGSSVYCGPYFPLLGFYGGTGTGNGAVMSEDAFAQMAREQASMSNEDRRQAFHEKMEQMRNRDE